MKPRWRVWSGVTALAGLLLFLLAKSYAGVNSKGAGLRDATTDRALVAARSTVTMGDFSRAPLAFTENQGQWDERVRFRAAMAGTIVWFCQDEIVYQFTRQLQRPEGISIDRLNEGFAPSPAIGRNEADSVERMALQMTLVGCNSTPALEGEDLLERRCNYFLGADPTKWRMDVPSFQRVIYREVYPGIDLVFYGRDGSVEHDFVVHAGADPAQIALRYEGAQSICLDRSGDLILVTAWGELAFHLPQIFETAGDGDRDVTYGGYCIADDGLIQFDIPVRRDPGMALVIDPILSYGTFLGGGQNDYGNGIAVDGDGNIYVAGHTYSTDFPMVGGYQTDQGDVDVFVTKIRGSDGQVVYSTYLGGSLEDRGNGIALDADGNAYITGVAYSADFPMKPLQVVPAGTNAFVTKLTTAGNGLVYSYYLGGGDYDVGSAIAVDDGGSAYVTGTTASSDFPIFGCEVIPGTFQAFVTKMGSNGFPLVYSTCLGGSGSEEAYGIAVDLDGHAYVTGVTQSPDFPTVNPVQTAQAGNDVFVAKFNATGDDLVYSTYLGGAGNDYGNAVAVDVNANAYVTGWTMSPDFPTVSEYQGFMGNGDAFVTKLGTVGNSLVYSTYLGGGGGWDMGRGIAVDDRACAYITGFTTSGDFPTTNSYQTRQSGNDVFVTKLRAAGNSLIYSSYLGGEADEVGNGIAIAGNHNACVTGFTNSANFPTQDPYQESLNGVYADAFVVRLRQTVHVVMSLDDSGEGSLREAIGIANLQPGRDSVIFAVAGVIPITSPLPYLSDVTAGTVIDGHSAPGSTPGNPSVIIDGALAGSGSGIEITSSDNTVRGLTIRGFPGAGVALSNPAAQGNTVSQNLIYDNGALGIGLAGTGPSISIDTAYMDDQDSTFYLAGSSELEAVVEVFLAGTQSSPDSLPDPSGHGEAWRYLGGVAANNVDGHWVVRGLDLPSWLYVTATATDVQGTTSGFAVNRLLVPDTFEVTVYSPVDIIVVNPSGTDSIGPGFNTFGHAASYDSLTDYGLGPNGIAGELDDRVIILQAELGQYIVKIVPEAGGSGNYFLGVRDPGGNIIGDGYVAMTGAGAPFISPEPVANPVPPAGELAVLPVIVAPQLRGDLNGDSIYDILDVVALIGVAFRSGEVPNPAGIADVNGDEVAADVLDVVRIIGHVFRGLPPPGP